MEKSDIRETKDSAGNHFRRVHKNGEMTAVLSELDQLSAEISARWPEGVSAVDAVNDVRREWRAA